MDFNTNVAKKLTETQSVERPQQSVHTLRQPVAISKFEYLLTGCCTLVICAMMISLVSAKISVNNAQRHLQNIQSQISKVNNSNISQQQEIGDLTSQDSLQKIAAKYHLNDSNTNVRNVNK
ncbi:cell division protein FtsL [uncultured Limosilactobacillus sp.]|uniref:cell division protein FtsL n=1 Tax=uncultured Limosilactobacillus sp. TaxID=2837629 RepID=UPI0025D3A0CC|nr:cell division protein FtsL [uncultured Limosilactobacillus sp.]